MDMQKEPEVKTEEAKFLDWFDNEYPGYKNTSNDAFSQAAKDFAFIGWLAAKASAVPDNTASFDGEYIKYPEGYAIHYQFDEDFDCHIFDVYKNEDCLKNGMTQLKQAHLFVCSMIEAAQEVA